LSKSPTISELIHHLKNCPDEFLQKPRKGAAGEIYTSALLNDVYRKISGNLVAAHPVKVNCQKKAIKELELIQIVCWLLSHPSFEAISCKWIPKFIDKNLSELAPLVKKESWISDEERAEELSRLVLLACGVIPAGETKAEAQDRLDSVNTVKRLKVIEESKAAMERAKAIRKKMAEKKAREAANVYGRE
jgi:hypothetical protein